MNGPVISSAPEGGSGEAAASAALLRPPAIPDYELVRQIGVGGYGEVWLARSTATGALRAVKFVRRATFTDSRPFEREFAGLKKFEAVSRAHPSQLALFHVGRDEAAGWFYYVIELADAAGAGSFQLSVSSVQSEDPERNATASLKTEHSKLETYAPRTLRSDLEAGRLPAGRVLELGLALSEALAHLHGHGLVHRDVKPSNLIFVNGRPKLADIGLVTDASDARSFVGTEGYLPPEGPGTPVADIFALGKVLYEALTGLDRRQYPELPADLRQWSDAALAFELNAVLVKACAADARHRYAGAEVMRADLERLAAGKSVKRRQAWRRIGSWSAKAAASLAACVLAFLMIQHAGSDRASPLKPSPETTNAAAAKELELGRHFDAQMSLHGATNSVLHFQRATELDPNSAAAWTGLAEAWFVLPHYSQRGQDSVRENVLGALDRALALKPDYLDARILRATCRKCYDRDWAAAEREYRRVIASDPKNGYVLNLLAWHLAQQARFREALELNARARAVVPSSTLHQIGHGAILAFAGRWEEALHAYQEVQILDPHSVAGGVAIAHYFLGHHAEAVREWLRLKQQEGASMEDIRRLQGAFDQHGIEGYFREEIALTLPLLQTKPGLELEVASLYARLGETNDAFEHLEIGLHTGANTPVSILKVNPFFAKLHGHPRFDAALKKLGLEP